jgi:tetratricopeptide (TPR) repeat protein
MSGVARACLSCGSSLGAWGFELCAGCLLRVGVEDSAPRDEAPDTPRIGAYRIVDKIAGGGMGTVYLAEQEEPRRLVAIKVVRDDLDGERVLDRFRYELEALGAMEHPGIARVYDSARHTDGRPYFVMEFVDGTPITAFATRHGLSRAARIDLFLDVCDAVRHAHQRGVIHRDLKPSNILVTIEGGRPRPKLIDFGVSRAVGGRRMGVTLSGEIVGTPAYMSPEQTMPGATVDTRTDVYGLGVVLYELLSGSVPDPDIASGDLPFDVVVKRIRENDPQPPSVKAGDRSLRGDFDAIILKAVAKEPARRYESVESFADDLRRHLRAEPVDARAPGAFYQASRFVSRHRWGVAAGFAFLLLLVSASAILAIQRVRLAQERVISENRAADSNAVSAFLTDIFTKADPKNPGSRTITVREAIDLASDHVLKTYGDRPAVRGMILSMLGHVQIGLGNYNRAKTLLTEAVSVLDAPLTAGGVMHAEALVRLANAEMRRGELKEAAGHLNLALVARERVFGATSLQVAEISANLGELAWRLDKPEEARPLYSRALDIRRAILPAADPRIGNLLCDLGDVAWALKDNQGAKRYYAEARELFTKTVGRDALQYGVLQNNLGLLYLEEGLWDDARVSLDDALRISILTQGPDHPELAETLNGVGRVALHDGDLARAEAMFRDTLRVARFGSQDDARKDAEDGLREIARRSTGKP